jgi:hypothetical protein
MLPSTSPSRGVADVAAQSGHGIRIATASLAITASDREHMRLCRVNEGVMPVYAKDCSSTGWAKA